MNENKDQHRQAAMTASKAVADFALVLESEVAPDHLTDALSSLFGQLDNLKHTTQSLIKACNAPNDREDSRKGVREALEHAAHHCDAAAGHAADAASLEKKRAHDAAQTKKVGFYQHPEDTARARGAWMATSNLEGDRSLSDFIAKAISREVERREALYNDGQQFPPIDTGNVSPGRRSGVNYD